MTTSRQLLILDLDETLIFASEEAPEGRLADFRVGPYQILRRPHLAEFLTFCREHFEVAVWTSSSGSYAAAVVAQIFGPDYPLAFVWALDRCTHGLRGDSPEMQPLKHLAKVRRRGYALERVLMVDDSPEKLVRSYGNLVQIRPFQGEPEDQELRYLMPYLLELKTEPNIRAVEKRGWRRRFLERS